MALWQEKFKLTPDNPPNEGIMFVDHEPQGRSGHMGHALVEYAPGKILAFYPNCSAEDERWKGHSGFGWMEYKRSTDGGETWSDAIVEPHSKALFDSNFGRSMMCEKAVCAKDGRIVLFYLTCDMVTNGHIWEPYYEPRYAFSFDGGETWDGIRLFSDKRGRIYDALEKDGKIYVLFFPNPELPGQAHSGAHKYELYVSEDNGDTFTLRSELPFQSTKDCLYGTMAFRPDGALVACIYEESDEYNLKYVVSEDEGKTWSVNRRMFFEKKIRNPQLTYFGGLWFMHGRTGCFGPESGHFVLYSSEDGVNWDEGCVLRPVGTGAGAYSNNLIVHDGDGRERLLIQSSHAYFQNRTSIIMWWLEKK